MSRESTVSNILYHWAKYVELGGAKEPETENVGNLKSGGIEHWSLFLTYGKKHMVSYPEDRTFLEGFIPKAKVKLLVGE